MTRSIYKYELRVDDEQIVQLPRGAQVLCVQTQRERPCLWCLVDVDAPIEPRTFRIYGTGHPFDRDPLDTRYIGTFQLRGGQLVFHVFEVITKRTA